MKIARWSRARGPGFPPVSKRITSWAMLPAADFEGIVVLRVWNSWGMSVSGGPTLHGLTAGCAQAGPADWGSHGNTEQEVGYRPFLPGLGFPGCGKLVGVNTSGPPLAQRSFSGHG